MQQRKPGNKTVHINPHFQGNVPVNNHGKRFKTTLSKSIQALVFVLARLKWDSHNQNSQFTKFKQPTARIAPWQSQLQENNVTVQQNFQQPHYQGYQYTNQSVNNFQQNMQQPFGQQMPQMVCIYFDSTRNKTSKLGSKAITTAFNATQAQIEIKQG